MCCSIYVSNTVFKRRWATVSLNRSRNVVWQFHDSLFTWIVDGQYFWLDCWTTLQPYCTSYPSLTLTPSTILTPSLSPFSPAPIPQPTPKSSMPSTHLTILTSLYINLSFGILKLTVPTPSLGETGLVEEPLHKPSLRVGVLSPPDHLCQEPLEAVPLEERGISWK